MSRVELGEVGHGGSRVGTGREIARLDVLVSAFRLGIYKGASTP